MKISEIYKKYQIPEILQNHMYKVAAVGVLIVKSLEKNIEFDINIVIKELLLHDMGNILKIPVKGNSFFSEKEQGLLIKIQEDFSQKFGKEEHGATLKIAKEIGISEDIIYILENTGSSKLSSTIDSNNWYLKVCSYADFRVSPKNIVSITERFDEIIQRYSGGDHILANIEKTEHKKHLALVLEKQIQDKSKNLLSEINDDKVAPIVEMLKDFEI